ncbi:MAG: hypothetical protein R3D55_14320 [Chloroflexota bacterium]
MLFGAFVVGQPTPQTWMAAGFIIVYILLVNGVNSSFARSGQRFCFWRTHDGDLVGGTAVSTSSPSPTACVSTLFSGK